MAFTLVNIYIAKNVMIYHSLRTNLLNPCLLKLIGQKKKNIIVNSIFLDAANEQEIIEICGTCCSGTAVGYDNISMNLIKESIDIIISPLTCIINLSITSGIVPKQLKIARVIP